MLRSSAEFGKRNSKKMLDNRGIGAIIPVKVVANDGSPTLSPRFLRVETP
jgi:hypothetical protein